VHVLQRLLPEMVCLHHTENGKMFSPWNNRYDVWRRGHCL
jgi:hypothetical protein